MKHGRVIELMECVGLDDASCKRQNSADNAPGHEFMFEKKLPDGSSYSVTIDQLKKSLLKVRHRFVNQQTVLS